MRRYYILLYVFLLVPMTMIGTAEARRCGCSVISKTVKPHYMETYSYLYIVSDPPGASVTTTNDGLAFDDGTGTPAAMLYRRSNYPYDRQPIGVLVYKPCFEPSFQRIDVNRWYRQQADATLNPIQVHAKLAPLSRCVP
jgi:hypothetical protein